jgi:SAM-dependent methyltransferase
VSDRGWSDFYKRWARSRPPLRPHAQVIDAIGTLLEGRSGSRLLLGVTPEYAEAFCPIVAVDWSAAMIDQIWPGSSNARRVIRSDWKDMPIVDGHIQVALGDGSLNMTHWPDDYETIFMRLTQVVVPGGRIVIRCFTAPDIPELVDTLANETLGGRVPCFHAFKWRLAHALWQEAAEVNMPIRVVWDAFQRLFPDRTLLSQATGWSLETIAEIDDYALSPLYKSFPTRAQLLATFPGGRLVESGDYEMAERCPILVIDL